MTIGNYTNLNMFNMNGMFGMGSGSNFLSGCGNNILGSIWNNCGNFYNCDGTLDSKAALGYNLVKVFGTIGLGVLGNGISKKQAAKAEEANKPSIDAQIKETNDKIAEQAKKLKVNTAEEAKACTADVEKTALDKATQAKVDAENHLKNLSGDIKSLNGELDIEKTKLQNLPADATEAQKQAIKDKISELNKEIGKKEKEQELLEKKVDANGELTNAVKEAQDKYDAKVTLINDVKAEIAKLEGTKAELEAQKAQQKANQDKAEFDKTADKADGCQLTRNSKLDIASEDYKKGDLKQGDLQELIHRYITAQDGSEQKATYARELKNLSEQQIVKAKGKTSQRTVIENARKYATKLQEEKQAKAE